MTQFEIIGSIISSIAVLTALAITIYASRMLRAKIREKQEQTRLEATSQSKASLPN